MRLIDADALLVRIMADAPGFLDGGSEITKAFIMAMINTKSVTPTINAIQVVRCRDCVHRPTDPENKGVGQSLEFPDDVCPCQIGDNWYSWMPKDDWFCADGERAENARLSSSEIPNS